MMKLQIKTHSAIWLSTLNMAAAAIAMVVVLIAQQGQTVTVPGLPGATDGAVKLVSLNVSNPLPYRVHDWSDDTTGNKTGRSSAVFPPVQRVTPDKRGEFKTLASPATVQPLNRDTTFSEPVSCHPGCKLA